MFKKNIPQAITFLAAGFLTVLLTFLSQKEGMGWFLVLGAIFLILTVLINLRSVKNGLLLFIFTLPFEYVGAFSLSGGPTGFKLRSSMITGGVLIFFWLLNFLRGKFKARPNYLLPFILIFLITLVLSFLQAHDLNRSFIVFLYTLFPLTICLILPQVISDQKILKSVLVAWFWTAFLVSLFGLFQFFGDLAGLPTSITFLREIYTKRVFGLPRIQGAALEPLLFANYLMTPLVIAASLLLSNQKTIAKKLPFFFLIIGLIVFIFTMSRGGYLGLVVSLLLIAFVYFRRFFRLKNILGFLVIVFAVLFLGLQIVKYSSLNINEVNTITEHFTNVFHDASNLERFVTYRAAIELFSNSPIFGIGLGNYGPHLAKYPVSPPVSGWATVNNETLEIMAELGLVGLLAALVLIGRVFLESLKTYQKSDDRFFKAVNVGAVAALLGMLVQWQFFSTLYTIQIWTLIGLLVAVHGLIKQND